MGIKKDRSPRKFENLKKASREGLIIVHTGHGEGKSTAAFGTALRALGWGHTVGIVQFLKGPWKTGEVEFFKKFPGRCTIFSFGKGFTWETGSYKEDVRMAQRAWETCCSLLDDDRYFLVIFDEINYVMKYNFLDVREVVRKIKHTARQKHVMLTGDGAPKELIRAADRVTEMKCIKHPYQKGIIAMPGIDY